MKPFLKLCLIRMPISLVTIVALAATLQPPDGWQFICLISFSFCLGWAS